MKTIKDNSIDAIITDPPYGTTACKWDSVIPFEPMWERLNKLIKPNGAIVMTASQPFTSVLICSNLKMFKYELIFEKTQGTSPGVAKYRPMPAHENICVFSNNKTTYNPIMRTGFNKWNKADTGNKTKNEHKYGTVGKINKKGTTNRFPLSYICFSQKKGHGNSFHPTQKPVALMEYLIKTYTNENETVLDFTMGSGTTGVACKNTNRDFVGIEMNEEYFKIAEQRINDTKYRLF